MTKKTIGLSLPVLCVTGILMLSGCAGGVFPDIVSEEKKEGEAYSPADVRRMTIDHPSTLSGDYFRNRNYPREQAPAAEQKSKTYAGKTLHSPEDKNAGKTKTEAELFPGGGVSVVYKIGLTAGPGVEQDLIGRHLSGAASGLSSENSLIIGPDDLARAVSMKDCRSEDVIECISRQAALYPGVHMLVQASSLTLPEAFPGTGSIDFLVMDTGISYVYQPIKISGSVQRLDDAGIFVRKAVKRALDFAMDKAGIMPAHCRIFSVKENRIYINAGKSGSISVGDQLEVVSSGHLVDTPTGVPVAWEPDAAKATLVVEKILRAHVSACSLLRGQAPEPGDIVLISGSR
jgi:hypothetical protein